MATVDLTPIPMPGGYPLIGNILEMKDTAPYKALHRLWRQYGDIYELNFAGTHLIIVNSRALAVEVLDERRFYKRVQGTVLEGMRNLAGDALFTAFHGEDNWGVAHRILTPAFGPVSVLGMFDDMYDILSQMILKWERFGPRHAIDVCKDLTRLTFDTIALCAMDHRLNSFYTEGEVPFIQAMNFWLTETSARFKRPSLVTAFMSKTNQEFEDSMQLMKQVAYDIIAERRKHPSDRKDLLYAMLNGKDPQTGNGLTDESIVQQLVTMLVAGHETTSGFVSFILLNLLKNPDAYAKLKAEVDEIVGTSPMQPSHVNKLPYLTAAMRETIRLTSTAPGLGVAPFQDEIIGGKYLVPKDQVVFVNIMNIHRDPSVWGEDAEEFRPERMMNGKFEALPPKAWLPFGNGARACIGRAFAWQEAQLAIVTMLQRFDFRLADPSYELDIKQSLTLKPANFLAYATPRKTGFTLGLAPSSQATPAASRPGTPPSGSGLPLHLLYGSNTGSCETFAQRIASEAAHHGFNASVKALDTATSAIPTDGPVIILTASFEGEPPDNAVRFVKYMESLPQSGSPLSKVKFAVFGCGNHDWTHTYQKVPRLLDELLETCGAVRLLSRGEADAGGNAFFDAFDTWENDLWSTLSKVYSPVVPESSEDAFQVELSASSTRASRLRQDDTGLGTVLSNVCLTKQDGTAEKRHIEMQLPEGVTYNAGDYVGVLGHNPTSAVKRVLSRFNLPTDQEITITTSGPTTLPTGRPISVFEVLANYVELAQPATRKNIETLVQHAKSESSRSNLSSLLEDYAALVLVKRRSVLNILELYPDIDLPIASFLSMLPGMRVRQYSISSSPLWNSSRVTVTLAVLREVSLWDTKELFHGVASNYLASLRSGDRIQLAVRSSNSAFRLPADCTIPVVLFASGAGVAPMRGFIQDRAEQKAAGREVGKATLYFGCRSPGTDFLYSDSDFKRWIDAGVLEVRPAFSRASDKSLGCRYVQDRVWHDRESIASAYRAGARFYTCGSLRVAQGIKEVFTKILGECQLADGEISVESMWAKIQNVRYAADVFG